MFFKSLMHGTRLIARLLCVEIVLSVVRSENKDFQVEADIMALLKHPHIVALRESFHWDGRVVSAKDTLEKQCLQLSEVVLVGLTNLITRKI